MGLMFTHSLQEGKSMTYEEFKAEYTALFKRMMGYSPSQAGASIYAERMAEMSDLYPEFAERAESE